MRKNLIEIIGINDEEIRNHSLRTKKITSLLAKELGLSESNTKNLVNATYFHDIGKISIPEGILYKQGKLNEKEFEIMKTHTEVKTDILTLLNKKYKMSPEKLNILKNVIMYHHENFDGSGYYNLEKNNIPFEARIIRVADVYDALRNKRIYKKSFSQEETLNIMEKEKTMFDPTIFNLLLKYNKQINILTQNNISHIPYLFN